jgi:hypothetical protein
VKRCKVPYFFIFLIWNTAIYKALINANIAMPSYDVIIHFADQETELTVSNPARNFKE